MHLTAYCKPAEWCRTYDMSRGQITCQKLYLSQFNKRNISKKVHHFYVMTIFIVIKQSDITTKNYEVFEKWTESLKTNRAISGQYPSHVSWGFGYPLHTQTNNSASAQFTNIWKRSWNSEEHVLQDFCTKINTTVNK